jgi:hypothetical protein
VGIRDLVVAEAVVWPEPLSHKAVHQFMVVMVARVLLAQERRDQVPFPVVVAVLLAQQQAGLAVLDQFV